MLVCPVCGKNKWRKAYKIDRWDIEECLFCAFAEINPMPDRKNRSDDYSEKKVLERNIKKRSVITGFFRAVKQKINKVTGRNKSGIFYKKLCEFLPKGSGILDIGCGDGSFLNLAKEGYDCAGIEISEYLAMQAGKIPNLKIITGNFLTADFTGKKYDGITLISLLEHLDDPAEALNKCFYLMNRGGVLLIKTVNYDSLNRKIRKENWTGFRPPDHTVYFSPSNLKDILKKAGFGKVKVSASPFSDNMYCDAWK